MLRIKQKSMLAVAVAAVVGSLALPAGALADASLWSNLKASVQPTQTAPVTPYVLHVAWPSKYGGASF